MCLAEDVTGCDARLIHRDVRERPRAGDVADGPHAVGGAQVIVHGNERAGVVDARGGHAQSRQVSAPPGSSQHALAMNGPRAVKVHREIAAVVADPPQPRPGQDADAFPAEYLADQLAGFRLLAGQQPVRGLDDRDRVPESGKRLPFRGRVVAPVPLAVQEVRTPARGDAHRVCGLVTDLWSEGRWRHHL